MDKKIICNSCGEIWWTKPNNNFNNIECPKCGENKKLEALRIKDLQYIKYLLEDCSSIDEVAEKLEDKAEEFRRLKKYGWTVESVRDGYIRSELILKVEEAL